MKKYYKIMKQRSFLPLLCVFFWIAPEASRAEITVASAISMGDTLEEVSKAYSAATGKKIRHAFSGTNVLARQIEEGAPIDVFISADTATMDGLVAKRLIEKEKVQVVATNELVVVVPVDNGISLKLPRDLLAEDRIAVADPDSVPAGIYAKRWLTAEGVWKSLLQKIIKVQNVRAALIAAETGNARAAIVYRSDAVSSKKVRIALVAEPEMTGPVEYPAGVVTSSKHKSEAEDFIEFLKGNAAEKIFLKHGFGKP